MILVGVEHLLALANGAVFDGKMVINARGAVFGPVSTQHRELRADGITYADEYKGTALAAMLAPGSIELRFHAAFTDRGGGGADSHTRERTRARVSRSLARHVSRLSTQHRELRADGITYADEYKGTALAAMLAPGSIELASAVYADRTSTARRGLCPRFTAWHSPTDVMIERAPRCTRMGRARRRLIAGCKKRVGTRSLRWGETRSTRSLLCVHCASASHSQTRCGDRTNPEDDFKIRGARGARGAMAVTPSGVLLCPTPWR